MNKERRKQIDVVLDTIDRILPIFKNIFLISLIIGLFYLVISSSQKVFIKSYNIKSSESIIVETFNVGMRSMSQSITFTDNSGTTQVLDNLVYDGGANPKTIYVYRIGRYKWSTFIRWCNNYEYYVTDKYVGDSFY